MIKTLTYKNVEPYVEALKELARIAVLASIPVLIDGLSAGRINWQLVATGALISILRGLDKLLHLEGKATGSDLMSRGLTQF